MKHLLIFSFLFSSFSAYSQFLTHEKELNKLGEQLLSQNIENTIKWEVLSQFTSSFLTLLENDSTNNYSFDNLTTTMVLTSNDKLFRLFSFNLCLIDTPCIAYGIIQRRNKKKEKFENSILTPLKNNNINEHTTYTTSNWYGALYYDLIETKHKKKKYYTLLGYSENKKTMGIKEKIIDIVTFSNSGYIEFGHPVFDVENKLKSRMIFQYSSDLGMSLSYQKNKIVFDHLSPKDPSMEGLYQFYGPSFSYGALKFLKGKWILTHDIAPENKKSK